MVTNSNKRKSAKLKFLLDKVLADFPPINRIDSDPIQFPRFFYNKNKSKVEVEAVALLSAMMAYGSVKQFTKITREILDGCNWNFLDLITKNKAEMDRWPYYRLSTAEEIKIFCKSVGLLIMKEKSIKHVFIKGYEQNNSIVDGLSNLHSKLSTEVKSLIDPIPRGIKHLMPNPASGGCAKRWQMFLRWMVRPDDGVDLGLWNEVSPSKLIIPLDLHISRIARNLGLTTRKADDFKTAVEISQNLAELEPNDPIKYDFSLCHLGIAGECTHGKDEHICQKCILKTACQFGKKLK